MEYKYSDDLLQRAYQAFKKYYKVELTKKECDKCLDDLAKLYIVLTEDN